jgi:KUP system potassium uptake protein
MRSFLSYENDLTFPENAIMRSYYFLRRFSIPDEEAYGLDASNVVTESVPVVVRELKGVKLKREK